MVSDVSVIRRKQDKFTIAVHVCRLLDWAAQTWVRRAGGTRGRQQSPGAKNMDAVSFAQANFGDVKLGHKRRTKRLVQAVEEMCRHPGGTLPDKLKRPADLRGFYRLMNRPEVTHEVLLQAHAAQTRRLMTEAGSVVLVLHDATELDYTSKLTLADALSQIGQGTRRGYICHNSLAVRADSGETLGLVSQILHRRAKVPEGETAKQSRERRNRESRLWLEGVKQSGPAPQGTLCVDVADTLSDTFEFLFYEITQGRSFVLRARENRRLQQALEEQNYLFDAVRQLPSAGQREVHVGDALPQRGKPRRPGRKGRKTQVEVAFAAVQLAPPGKKLGEYEPQPLDMWAVRVWESNLSNPAAGEEPLEWILLTNRPVHSLADAMERIDWYERRWIIEEYHKSMKTGCSIEAPQFVTTQALQPTIAVISAVATTLLRLRDAGRAADAATRPATHVVDPIYVRVLHAYYGSLLGATPSVRLFYLRVARLGGHQNRKSDGMPGWLTLWRGWMKLESMVAGYASSQHGVTSCGQT